MATNYINDQWLLDDSLGMGRAGDALARMVLEVQAPFTIGVTGKWGAGKTSVLRQAFVTLGGQPISQSLKFAKDKSELEGQDFTRLRHDKRSDALGWKLNLHIAAHRALPVWYSPWQHQNADNPLIPLLYELRAQYSNKRKLKAAAEELNRRGGLAVLGLLEHLIDAAISMEAGKPMKLASGAGESMLKAWREEDPDNPAKPSDGQRFHLLFEDAVDNLLDDLQALFDADEQAIKSKFPGIQLSQELPTRIIFFIDDLDRCEEKTVVSLLEAIKLYLGTRRCVFVLGVDDGAVAMALKRHWQGRSDDHNREYLEKLFQATLPVPLPRPEKLQNLVFQQLAEHGVPESTALSLAMHITHLLEPNPRKVKNFLNSLCAAWTMLRCPELETPENCQRLVMFQYLRQYHRAVWRILERQPHLLPVLQRVLNCVELKDLPIKGLPTHLDQDDLRMTYEVFSRSFSHVLKDILPKMPASSAEAIADPLAMPVEKPKLDRDKTESATHRRQKLDEVAEHFLERLDRKRSDEYFVCWVREVLQPDDVLHDLFLRIPA